MGEITPFKVQVAEDVLDDLRRRLRDARWPDQIPGTGWDLGTDTAYLKDLCAYWESGFDWRAVEAELNRWPQIITTIDGQRVHAIHARSPHPQARALLMVHGWPSTPLEFIKVLAPLTDPVAFGGRAEDAFHVVAPSIPGYAWSGPTTELGWGPHRIAAAFAELVNRLGYERYGAFGTDMGSPINTELARQVPDRLIGLQLTLLISSLRPKDGVLTAEEAEQIAANDRLRNSELGYVMEQSTKPQTIAFNLTDSPVGQAAWIVEKFRSWTDCDGDVESAVTRDEILADITTFWVTRTGGSSARLYYEMYQYFASGKASSGRVEVPTGVTVFPKELYRTSRRIANDHYAIEHWNQMPRGGHFAALEQPDLLVGDIRAFFAGRN